MATEIPSHANDLRKIIHGQLGHRSPVENSHYYFRSVNTRSFHWHSYLRPPSLHFRPVRMILTFRGQIHKAIPYQLAACPCPLMLQRNLSLVSLLGTQIDRHTATGNRKLFVKIAVGDECALVALLDVAVI